MQCNLCAAKAEGIKEKKWRGKVGEAKEAGRKKAKEEGRGEKEGGAAEAGFATATGKIMMLSKMNLFHFHVKANFVVALSVSVTPLLLSPLPSIARQDCKITNQSQKAR